MNETRQNRSQYIVKLDLAQMHLVQFLIATPTKNALNLLSKLLRRHGWRNVANIPLTRMQHLLFIPAFYIRLGRYQKA